ncbi:MAG: hypothetical protein EB075_14955, partial [Bacteroidetes bacterium]|nr:hypothetical protein [Bacteroidota bacterium]
CKIGHSLVDAGCPGNLIKSFPDDDGAIHIGEEKLFFAWARLLYQDINRHPRGYRSKIGFRRMCLDAVQRNVTGFRLREPDGRGDVCTHTPKLTTSLRHTFRC